MTRILAVSGFLVLLAACGRDAARSDAPTGSRDSAVRASVPPGMVLLPGGSFAMGSADGYPDEAPVHRVQIQPFWMEEREVSVAEFARFVSATGYETDAERLGWSGVFDLKERRWKNVTGASWRYPEGPGSEAGDEEPVTQVSWHDAMAFANWAGKRLPTEAEWEYAARGGLEGKPFPWGDEPCPHGACVANWWQGQFPGHNSGEDGYLGRAPVGSYPPNGFGLYDMSGNVWEWTADWYDGEYYARSPEMHVGGPRRGSERVLRGGSWMCSLNYCLRFRSAARSHATPESGLNNAGFRCARDATVSSGDSRP